MSGEIDSPLDTHVYRLRVMLDESSDSKTNVVQVVGCGLRIIIEDSQCVVLTPVKPVDLSLMMRHLMEKVLIGVRTDVYPLHTDELISLPGYPSYPTVDE